MRLPLIIVDVVRLLINDPLLDAENLRVLEMTKRNFEQLLHFFLVGTEGNTRSQKADIRDNQKIALEGVTILFSEAGKIFSQEPELSDRYVRLARKIAMKYKVKMPSKLKRRFCKKGGSVPHYMSTLGVWASTGFTGYMWGGTGIMTWCRSSRMELPEIQMEVQS